MNRAYRDLLVLQSVLAAANSMAAVFALLFLRDQGGFADGDVVLLNALAFTISAAGCAGFVRIGAHRPRALMAAGLVALALSYLVYLFLQGWPLLLAVAIAWGAYIPLYFLPFNALVIAITKPEDRARKIGTFILAYTTVGIAGPTIGGLIVDRAGWAPLFATAVVVLLIDGVLLLRLRDASTPVSFAFDFRGMGARTSLALFAEGSFEGMAFGVIPLIAYGFTTVEFDLGRLFSLFALAGGVVTVVLGTLSDRFRNRGPFLRVGAAASALAALLVVTATTLAGFALGNSLLALASSVAPVFLFAIAVERVPGQPTAAIVTREVLLNAGRAASLSLVVLLLAGGVSMSQAFLLAAGSLGLVALAQAGPRHPVAMPDDNHTGIEKTPSPPRMGGGR